MAWKNKRGMPHVEREVITIDATDKVVGRLASQIARLLMGKHKATYTPHIDAGAIVKIVNAKKMVLTGKKMVQKNIYRSSNRPSGITTLKVGELMVTDPAYVLEHAVEFMLPKNRTQNERLKRLIIAA